jgi:hypothetical protein
MLISAYYRCFTYRLLEKPFYHEDHEVYDGIIEKSNNFKSFFNIGLGKLRRDYINIKINNLLNALLSKVNCDFQGSLPGGYS